MTRTTRIMTVAVGFGLVLLVSGPMVAQAAVQAQDDTATVRSGDVELIPVLDNDGGTGLVITDIGAPGHGTAEAGPDSSISYKSTLGYSGNDSFTYKIKDGTGAVSTATVSIKVMPRVDGLGFPRVLQGSSITVDNLAASDYGVNLRVVSIGRPAHGTAVLANGKITYTPTPSYYGDDKLDYVVEGPTSEFTASGTAEILVMPVLVAVDDYAVTVVDRAVKIRALDNDTWTAGAQVPGLPTVSSPAHGNVKGDREFVYTPEPGFVGTDTFTYTLKYDPAWKFDTPAATATVTVYVRPMEHAENAVTTPAGKPVTFPIGPWNGVGMYDTPSNGVLTFGCDTDWGWDDGCLVYTPNPGFTGQDLFHYEVIDSHVLMATTYTTHTVTVTVQPVILVDGGGSVASDSPIPVAVALALIVAGFAVGISRVRRARSMV